VFPHFCVSSYEGLTRLVLGGQPPCGQGQVIRLGEGGAGPRKQKGGKKKGARQVPFGNKGVVVCDIFEGGLLVGAKTGREIFKLKKKTRGPKSSCLMFFFQKKFPYFFLNLFSPLRIGIFSNIKYI